MATFKAKKLDLTQINGGQEYEQGDFLQSDTINDVVEGTAYAQNVAEAANTKSNNAVSTANSANSTANAASTKVNTFEQRITTAQNTADTAVSNAATAQSTADSATTEINKIKNGTTVVPNANHANNADNANLATKAQQDVNGNPINTTYATVEYVDDLVTEKQGTRVTVNNANVAELSFTSDPQTQIDEAQSDISDIVSGAQTVGKATQDANGNVIDETYAKLSQVVRTDAAQTLNNSQKQIARNNITTFISKGLPSAGWYRIAELSTYGFFEIEFCNVYYALASSPCKVFISCGALDSDKYSLTSINSNNPSPHVKSVRLISIENRIYIDFYYNGTMSNDTVGIIMSGISYNEGFAQITPIDFTPVDNTGTILTSLDMTAGINTTGGVYQNGSPVFATDPTKLAPSTANGWTQTTATGTLPSAGVYMISARVDFLVAGAQTALTPKAPAIGVFISDNSSIKGCAIFYMGGYTCMLEYDSGDANKWSSSVIESTDRSITGVEVKRIYYKRIA